MTTANKLLSLHPNDEVGQSDGEKKIIQKEPVRVALFVFLALTDQAAESR
ncbi:hypothetical protein [Actibacterium pelagium]|nr:hypothetical protein [Actibacterium pelagium]